MSEGALHHVWLARCAGCHIESPRFEMNKTEASLALLSEGWTNDERWRCGDCSPGDDLRGRCVRCTAIVDEADLDDHGLCLDCVL